MNMKEEHIVPLSRQAMGLLKQLNQISGDKELLFPGDHDVTKVMSENTVNSALRAMGYDTKPKFVGMDLGPWHEVCWVSQAYGATIRLSVN